VTAAPVRSIPAPTLAQVQLAAQRIRHDVLRTPLVRYQGDPGEPEIWLKLENLQPIGSFKLRGAMTRVAGVPRSLLGGGLYTASAGNMAQGVAYAARLLGVPASVVVPESAPATKLAAVERLGASIVRVPYDEWWTTMKEHGRADMPGIFVHPFADTEVMAGNGTIALEILDELEDVDTILVPWGGGGLTCGIAAAARAMRPGIRVIACEVEGSAPLSASLRAGRPLAIENQRSFIDGIGGKGVFPEMWPCAQQLVSGALTTTVGEVAEAVRLLAQRAHIVAEGAGAAALAVARGGLGALTPMPKRIVCIVSGGNIDAAILASILSGAVP